MQKKQPRILHIITKLAVGGAQYNTLISTRDIAEKGYYSDILTGPEKPSEGDLFDLADKWNLNIITAKHLKRNISPLCDFLALCEIKKIISKGKYNIVHTHGSKARFLGRIAAAASKRVIVVQTAHGWPFYDSMNTLKEILYVTLEKIGFNLAHINICVSPRDRDKALGHGLGHFDDYRIVRSGVNFEEFRAARGSGIEARKKLGISPGAKVVGSVMRFCPEKAPDIYIRVAAEVIKAKPESIFILVGDGPLRQQTEGLIDSMQLGDNIILLGSRKDVADILPAFDLFLITSRTEGLPRALLESLAAGVPVVSTDVGGIHELIHDGRNGFLSDEGDIESLAADVNRILDFPDMTREMMAHVDEDLEPFSARQMVNDLYLLYTQIISPALNVVFLCDDEPFNIPKTIARIIRKRPFNNYTLISLRGHGSLSKPVLNIRRYMNLYGRLGFFIQFFKFAALKMSGMFLFPTRFSHSLRQTARREHADYRALDRINSKKSRDYLRSLDPDVFISVACPQILRKKVLKIPELGAWNVHSALLPRHRGMLPTFWSLYNGDTPGVTLHEMVRELDAGEILIQSRIDCSINDTTLHQLLSRTKHLAADVITEGLDLLDGGDYTLLPNPSAEATMNKFPSKKDVQKFQWLGGKITGIRNDRPKVAISFDVEEWFQTYAARKWYPNDKWDQINSRIDSILDRILLILDDHNAKATFFFLGWIVERHPELVLKILNKGHEIGYHGYNHVELTSLTKDEFRSNLDRFFELIDSLSIPAPVGFRAPSFSMKRDTSWAVDDIVARGFKYDSSVYPMFKLRYGIPEAPQIPFNLNGENSSIIELPLASLSVAGLKVPVAGGAYFRFYPGLIHRLLLRSVARTGRIPVLYFHPWEIDSINISSRMNLFQRVRQHHNSGQNTISKLHKILKFYRGITLRELAEEVNEKDLPDFNL
jgi:polysaccharide deacetylase family protein (PEP-CTERM system associated)